MSIDQQEMLRRAREQAWNEGYQACAEGKQRFRNPYRQVDEGVDKVLNREHLG